MIRTEKEYRDALNRLAEDEQMMEMQRDHLRGKGYTDEQVEYGMQPLLAFHEQLCDDIRWYERAKNWEFDRVYDLTDMQRMLIALRIAAGISQAELARRLNVDESQVSRDEHNEYHGITLARAQRIMTVLQAQSETEITKHKENVAIVP